MKYEVKIASLNELNDIALIHLQTIDIGILPKLGENYLKKIFYPKIINNKYVLPYILKDINDKTIGIAIFLQNNSLFKVLGIKTSLLSFLYVVRLLCKTPVCIFDVIQIFNPLNKINKFIEKQKNINIELFIFAISPQYQNKGLGTILLKESLKLITCRFVNNITVFVKTHSELATKLYKKLGFKLLEPNHNRGRFTINILKKNIITCNSYQK